MPRLPRHDLFRAILLAIRPGRHHDLARQIEFLREENRILRSRLPRRVVVTPKERALFVRLGKPLGRAIDGLVSIVTPKTFARWASGARRSASGTVAGTVAPGRPSGRPPGRPPVGSEIADLVKRMASETDWGYTRIHHELRKLGVADISRSSVANIVRATRGPGGSPEDSSTWDQFIRAHAETLWACDFLSRKVWTARGLVEHFVLFFIHVGSRRVMVSPATAKPDAAWMAEQARRFAADVSAENDETSTPLRTPLATPSTGTTPEAAPGSPGAPDGARAADETRMPILLRDNDRKFTREFDATLRRAGIKPHPLPIQSPNLNAFAERWVQTVKRECLDHFVVFGSAHLDHLMREFVDYYHRHRPHQGLGGKTVDGDGSRPTKPTDPIETRTRLGGRLIWYERRAA